MSLPKVPHPVAKKGEHAVVIGGSMAGLLAARALAEHFERVTLVERDQFPDGPLPRKGVPQARHIHILLWRGQLLLEEQFPGLQADLEQAGAPRMDWLNDLRNYVFTGWLPNFPTTYLTHPSSRDLLEWAIRRRVAALPNLQTLQNTEVDQLLADEAGSHILGVRCRLRHQRGDSAEDLPAELVVDASGRNSRVVEWLAALGYPTPQETLINSFLGYASRVYQAPAGWSEWKSLVVRGIPPADKRGGMIQANEDGRWRVTLAGAAHDNPPTDEAGFLEFARSLVVPNLYEALMQAKPLTPISGYRKTANRWRHFERLPRWPDNFLVTGDAVCAFNPVYGQGMSVAAEAAALLSETFHASQANGGPLKIGHAFQKKLAGLIKFPWLLATGEDFRYPETEGGHPTPLTRLTHAYVDRVIYAALEDPLTYQTFLEVSHLVRPLSAFFSPHILVRALRQPHPATRAY